MPNQPVARAHKRSAGAFSILGRPILPRLPTRYLMPDTRMPFNHRMVSARRRPHSQRRCSRLHCLPDMFDALRSR